MRIKHILFTLCLAIGFVHGVHAQKSYASYCVGFYNVENLFDTEDDPNNSGDNDFLPDGPYNWTPAKYNKKIDNIAKVISRLGKEYTQAGPAILGVAEVENRKVLEDLVKNNRIADVNYQVVHYDSPDRRGIDVGLLYNPKLFQVTNSVVVPYYFPDEPNFKSRDQLLVSGMLAGEPFHVIVAHWPSRYGGNKSTKYREQAASITKAMIDSLQQIDPYAKIVFMGDLNDDPVDRSTRIVLNAKKDIRDVKKGGLYNTMWKLYDKGIGSLGYQNKWNLFDQIIISYGLLGKHDQSGLMFWKSEVFNRDFLIQKEGKRKGYPWRTFDGNTFIDGYSDHFPTLIYLIKEI